MQVESLEELKEKIKIYDVISKYVNLRWDGVNYVGLCPFHQEKTPSFKVSPSKNRFHCFGCGTSGSIIDFIMLWYNKPIHWVVEFLCKEFNMNLIEQPNIIKESRRYRPEREYISEKGVQLRDNSMDEFPENHHIDEWIAEGIDEDILTEHNVRYDVDRTRILFPLYDEQNPRTMVAIKYRNLWTNNPKYGLTNKMGKKTFLYWWGPNIKYIKEEGECILVESEKSVMKLESIGIRNCVAVMSHTISKEQMATLISAQTKSVVIAMDKDVPYKEIMEYFGVLKHYANCSIMLDRENLLGEKEAPIDRGKDIWTRIYENRVRI